MQQGQQGIDIGIGSQGYQAISPDDPRGEKEIKPKKRKENISISNSLYSMATKKCSTVFSTIASIGELIGTAANVLLLEKLYNDYQDDNSPFPIQSISIVLSIGVGTKIASFVADYLITTVATQESSEIAEEVASDYFSSPIHKNGDAEKATRLIFDSFDIIRPTLAMIHQKALFKLLEMIIYSGALVYHKECNIVDVAIIDSVSLGLTCSILYLEYRRGKSRIKQEDVLKEYEDIYGYISSTVRNYETVKVFDASSKLIDDIRDRVTKLSKKMNRSFHGVSGLVGITDSFMFLIMAGLAAYLAHRNNYRGDQFIYLFLFSLEQSVILKDFSEAFYKINQALTSFKEVNNHLRKHRFPTRDELKGTFNSINFSNVKFGKFWNLEFEIKSGDKIFIDGPSGCGKSSILKLLSGLYGLKNEAYDIVVCELPNDQKIENKIEEIRAQEEFQDRPILFKCGNGIRINGFTKSDEDKTVYKAKTTNDLDPNQFKELKFSEQPTIQI